jgi:lipopolysaccharide/colanic/teichoic acid biosynthesis glycosyltransferase
MGESSIMIRLFDIFVSVILILISSILVLPFVLIKIFSDGVPLFYLSKRVGLYGNEITVYKFRTMINDPVTIKLYINNIANNEVFQRIPVSSNIYTRIGRWFEKLQLVELPQLYNVLLGNMSLVGNRPLPKDVNLKLKEKFGEKVINDRVKALPGMTGVSQIIGKYGLTDFERLEYEVKYVEFIIKSKQIHCIYLNLLILLETACLIFFRTSISKVNNKIILMLEINLKN